METPQPHHRTTPGSHAWTTATSLRNIVKTATDALYSALNTKDAPVILWTVLSSGTNMQHESHSKWYVSLLHSSLVVFVNSRCSAFEEFVISLHNWNKQQQKKRVLCWQILVGMNHWHPQRGGANRLFWCTRDLSSDGFVAKPSLLLSSSAQISGKCLESPWLLFRQTSTVVWPIIASVACCTIVGFVCALWGSDGSWDMQEHPKKGDSYN